MINSTTLGLTSIVLTFLFSSCREFSISAKLPEPAESINIEGGRYELNQQIELLKDDEELYSMDLDIDLRRVQVGNKVEWMVGDVSFGSGGKSGGFHLAEIPYRVFYYYVDSLLNFEMCQEIIISEHPITYLNDQNPSNRPYAGFDVFTTWQQDTLKKKNDTLKVEFGRLDNTDPPFGRIILKYHFESKGDELVLISQEFENSESLKALKEIRGSDSYFLTAKTPVPKSITTLRSKATVTPMASSIPDSFLK